MVIFPLEAGILPNNYKKKDKSIHMIIDVHLFLLKP